MIDQVLATALVCIGVFIMLWALNGNSKKKRRDNSSCLDKQKRIRSFEPRVPHLGEIDRLTIMRDYYDAVEDARNRYEHETMMINRAYHNYLDGHNNNA